MCLRIYLIFNKFSQSSFQLSVKKDPRLLQFCWFFRSVIGLENSHLSLNQSNAGTKNQSHLGQSRFPRFHQVACFWFLIGPWWCWPFFFWLVVVITLVMLVDNHWSLFYFIVCYMPQKVSQRNAKRYLNSLWLSPSLKPVDQVLSKLSLKKTACFATVNGWFWAKILLNKSSEKRDYGYHPSVPPLPGVHNTNDLFCFSLSDLDCIVHTLRGHTGDANPRWSNSWLSSQASSCNRNCEKDLQYNW